MCPKTSNCRYFAYITVPYHVYKEIVKLNDVIFKSKPIKIEDAKVKPKTSHSNTKFLETVLIQYCKSNKPTINNISRSISSQQHIYLFYNHHTRKTLSLKVKEVMYQREQLKKAIIFGDTTPKGINMRLLSKKNDKVHSCMSIFPGAASKDFLHYIKSI